MTIGDRIKQCREAKKITQTELADIVGTTKQNIYKYESGIITNIPSDKIEAIAAYFEVSPAYIMGWEDSDSKIETKNNCTKTEKEVKLIARKTKNLPEEEREALLDLLNNTVDTFLKAKGIKND